MTVDYITHISAVAAVFMSNFLDIRYQGNKGVSGVNFNDNITFRTQISLQRVRKFSNHKSCYQLQKMAVLHTVNFVVL